MKDEASAMKGYYGFELLHQDLCTGEHHRYLHEKTANYDLQYLRVQYMSVLFFIVCFYSIFCYIN